HRLDRLVQIYPVTDGPREPLLVAIACLRVAGAVQVLAVGLIARARVCGEHELESCRHAYRATRSGNDHLTVLEWLTQRVEDGWLELRGLVEEQDAPVRKGDRSRPSHPSPATDDRRQRRGMVRIAEGRAGEQRRVRW